MTNHTSQQLNYSIGNIQLNRAPKRSNAFSVFLAVAGFVFSDTHTHTQAAHFRVHRSIYRRVYTVSFQLAAAKPQAYRKYGIGVNACKPRKPIIVATKTAAAAATAAELPHTDALVGGRQRACCCLCCA